MFNMLYQIEDYFLTVWETGDRTEEYSFKIEYCPDNTTIFWVNMMSFNSWDLFWQYVVYCIPSIPLIDSVTCREFGTCIPKLG